MLRQVFAGAAALAFSAAALADPCGSAYPGAIGDGTLCRVRVSPEICETLNPGGFNQEQGMCYFPNRPPAQQFPSRSGGSMADSVFRDSLAKTFDELTDTIGKYRAMERAIAAGTGGANSAADLLDTGVKILGLMQQVQAMQNARGMGLGGTNLSRNSGSSQMCSELLRMANQCRVSQGNMASIGTQGRGTTGQAGAFNDCYNNYMGAYRASCQR